MVGDAQQVPAGTAAIVTKVWRKGREIDAIT